MQRLKDITNNVAKSVEKCIDVYANIMIIRDDLQTNNVRNIMVTVNTTLDDCEKLACQLGSLKEDLYEIMLGK